MNTFLQPKQPIGAIPKDVKSYSENGLLDNFTRYQDICYEHDIRVSVDDNRCVLVAPTIPLSCPDEEFVRDMLRVIYSDRPWKLV